MSPTSTLTAPSGSASVAMPVLSAPSLPAHDPYRLWHRAQCVVAAVFAAVILVGLLSIAGLGFTNHASTTTTRPAPPPLNGNQLRQIRPGQTTGGDLMPSSPSSFVLTSMTATASVKCQGPGAPTEQQLIGCSDYTITGRPSAPTDSGTAQWTNLATTFSSIFGLAAGGIGPVDGSPSFTDDAGSKIPDAWGAGQPARTGGGWRWSDPATKPGTNYVRVDPGDPTSSDPLQRVPHVHVSSGGIQIADHLPLSVWLRWPSWNTP
jgi:hypothetical protein